MKTYKLFTFVAGERMLSKYPDAEAKGIVEAEKIANELLETYIHEAPCDTFVACVEDEWDLHCNNYLCWQEDYFGERYWKMMENGYWCPIGMRLLTEYEREELDLLREEKEIHIWDLDEEQLKSCALKFVLAVAMFLTTQTPLKLTRMRFAIIQKAICRSSKKLDVKILKKNLQNTA